MRLVAVIVSFLLATAFEMAGSWLCLVPSQGMKGNERFLLVFLGLSIAFAVVNALGAGLGLFPLLVVYDAKTWSRTVLGFVAGSVLAALCWSAEWELIPWAARPPVLVPVVLVIVLGGVVGPPVGGLIAFIRLQRKRNRIQPRS